MRCAYTRLYWGCVCVWVRVDEWRQSGVKDIAAKKLEEREEQKDEEKNLRKINNGNNPKLKCQTENHIKINTQTPITFVQKEQRRRKKESWWSKRNETNARTVAVKTRARKKKKKKKTNGIRKRKRRFSLSRTWKRRPLSGHTHVSTFDGMWTERVYSHKMKCVATAGEWTGRRRGYD